MRFDYTEGKTEKYIVSLYWDERNSDHFYFHEYRKAKNKFDKLKDNALKGATITLYDLIKDVRKEFVKL